MFSRTLLDIFCKNLSVREIPLTQRCRAGGGGGVGGGGGGGEGEGGEGGGGEGGGGEGEGGDIDER